MPKKIKRGSVYQYGQNDSPLTVAQQFNLQPSQLINANPGGYPFTTGQTLNIPNFMSPGAPNPYQAAINAQPPRPAPRTATGIAGAAMGVINPSTPTNFTTANSFYTPRPIGNAYSYMQSGNTPGAPSGPGANSFTSGSNVNTQTGMNNQQFVLDLGERILANPAEFDSLPQSAQDAIRQSLQGGASSQADPADSPGGRFIQVGEKRWERNAKGKLVHVQYTGGGSWRNKRILSGGKNQSNAARGIGQQPAVREENGRLTGIGVVNFNLSSG